VKALQLTASKQDPQFREVPDPEPGPGQVLVRVGGAGACHSDLHLMHDFEPGLLPYEVPFTLGHENAGWVEALGPGASGLEVGQPVAVYGPWGCGWCYRCKQGLENYCERQAEIGASGGGLGRDGGMAPLLLVPSPRLLVPLGDLDPALAAPLTDAGLTPYHAIKRSWSKLVPRSAAVVIGAGGGLGHLAVQILAATTATTIIAVDSRQQGLDLAAEVGAAHGVLAGQDAADQIRDLTGGAGAELVLDLVGNDATLALSAAVARPLGDVTLVGIGGGSHPFGFFTVPYEVSLQSTYWGSIGELVEVIALAERGAISSHVERFSLDEAPAAYEALAQGQVAGRAVIVPG
jgi:alcohol dehydrogenase, propanol-preferring